MLDDAGADALVLFNRFYQPDLDLEELTVGPNLVLSTSDEMRLPLRWIAILYGKIRSSLALTTGVHTPEDVIKAMMAGADVANVCSVLLQHGVGHISTLLTGVTQWMEEHEYESVDEMKGSLSQRAVRRAGRLRTRQLHEDAAELSRFALDIGISFTREAPDALSGASFVCAWVALMANLRSSKALRILSTQVESAGDLGIAIGIHHRAITGGIADTLLQFSGAEQARARIIVLDGHSG